MTPTSLENLDAGFELPRGPEGVRAAEVMARENAPSAHAALSALDVRPHDRVLEIGFGPGVALPMLAGSARRGRVVGIDPSEVMVHEAAMRNRGFLDTGRVVLLRGEVPDLPFRDGAFTKACAIHTFALWPDPEGALAAVRRVLAEGGRLVLVLHVRPGDARGPGIREGEARDVVAQLAHAGFRNVHRHRADGAARECFVATK